MKILVTGAAGFIHIICKSLLLEKYQIVGLDSINDYYDIILKFDRLISLGIKKEQSKVYNKKTSYDNFEFIRLDLERQKLMIRNEKFDVVCNSAAQAGVRYSLTNPDSYINIIL